MSTSFLNACRQAQCNDVVAYASLPSRDMMMLYRGAEHAAAFGQISVLKSLAAYLPLNYEYKNPMTQAARRNRLPVIRYLLNINDDLIYIALTTLISHGHAESAREFIPLGAQDIIRLCMADVINQNNLSGFDFLLEHDKSNFQYIFTKLLECKLTNLTMVDRIKNALDLQSCLHQAVQNDNQPVAKYLVSHGADPTKELKETFVGSRFAQTSLLYELGADLEVIRYLVTREYHATNFKCPPELQKIFYERNMICPAYLQAHDLFILCALGLSRQWFMEHADQLQRRTHRTYFEPILQAAKTRLCEQATTALEARLPRVLFKLTLTFLHR